MADNTINFLLTVMNKPKFRDGVLESFLYAPTRSVLTFGYGGGLSAEKEEDQRKWDIQMD